MPDEVTRLLTIAEVCDRLQIHRASIYRRMRSGHFPEPLKISARAVRWRADEVEAWIASRDRATGETPRAAA